MNAFDTNSVESGLKRRDVMLTGVSAAALALGIGIAGRPARAAGIAGQCIDAFTQEAVNFNPLLYVNTGVETSVEFIVFDALWKLDPTGAFLPNLAAEIPSRPMAG